MIRPHCGWAEVYKFLTTISNLQMVHVGKWIRWPVNFTTQVEDWPQGEWRHSEEYYLLRLELYKPKDTPLVSDFLGNVDLADLIMAIVESIYQYGEKGSVLGLPWTHMHAHMYAHTHTHNPILIYP